MNNRSRGPVWIGAAAVLVVGLLAYVMSGRRPEPVRSTFAQSVDLSPLSLVAVQDRGFVGADGQLMSFDSFARSMLRLVSGPHPVFGQWATFSYLDMLFRPEAYQDADVIYVKKPPVRQRIAGELAADPTVPRDRLERFQHTGLISPLLLSHPRVTALLDVMEADVIRTAQSVRALRTAVVVMDPRTLSNALNVIPPPGGDADSAWLPGDQVWGGPSDVPQDAIHAGMGPRGVPGLDPELERDLASAWRSLAAAWRQQDAAAASGAIATVADLLPRVEPSLYPPVQKLQVERWYFRYRALVWTWVFYLMAAVPLLMSVAYRWRRAYVVGMVLFLVPYALHTAALGVRWYLSGRIPNSNMYEAITASTWFGAGVAFVLEGLVRKTPLRGLFALGAAVCASVAMMCSHYMPVTLNSDIVNIMPVLHDVWLYIHTNVIISSYCLIGMAAVTALLYLVYRAAGGSADYAQAGGAGALILAHAPGGSFLRSSRTSAGQVLDGATMVLMELAFVLLWAGLVMGAIWADHSWGRPWGWDPKEVFALNTFIVFLLLVHVRLKVRDKGFWTAVLACAGCGVMLFNWIVINFVITGLHSYA